jgi:hypothetical protein
MAQLVTLIIASRSCSILGSGTLSQRMSVVPCQTSAFTATSAVIHSVGFININPARAFQSGIIAIRQNGETHPPALTILCTGTQDHRLAYQFLGIAAAGSLKLWPPAREGTEGPPDWGPSPMRSIS